MPSLQSSRLKPIHLLDKFADVLGESRVESRLAAHRSAIFTDCFDNKLDFAPRLSTLLRGEERQLCE